MRGQITATMFSIILVLAVSIVLMLSVILVSYKFLSNQLKRMSKETKRIVEGDLSHKISLVPKDAVSAFKI